MGPAGTGAGTAREHWDMIRDRCVLTQRRIKEGAGRKGLRRLKEWLEREEGQERGMDRSPLERVPGQKGWPAACNDIEISSDTDRKGPAELAAEGRFRLRRGQQPQHCRPAEWRGL